MAVKKNIKHSFCRVDKIFIQLLSTEFMVQRNPLRQDMAFVHEDDKQWATKLGKRDYRFFLFTRYNRKQVIWSCVNLTQIRRTDSGDYLIPEF